MKPWRHEKGIKQPQITPVTVLWAEKKLLRLVFFSSWVNENHGDVFVQKREEKVEMEDFKSDTLPYLGRKILLWQREKQHFSRAQPLASDD